MSRAPLALLASFLLVSCGGHTRSSEPSAGQITAAFKGSPPVLAALHGQADQLLGGGASAFQARLERLRGYPVVVNKWASWCGPCQSEFPIFQQVAVKFGRHVAFIGLDGNDHPQAARAFLRKFPVTYPSYLDPDQDIARQLQAAVYFPQTVYINARGTQIYTHVGPYETVSALERDLHSYLLGGA